MAVLAIFMTGVVTVLTTALHTTGSSYARAAATNQAEVRLEVMTRDLRNAVNCPSGVSLGTGSSATSGIAIQVSAGPQIQMCDPSSGLPAANSTSQLPQTSIVTWTCAFGAGSSYTCSRCVTATSAAAPGSCTSSSSGLTNVMTGVLYLGLTGLSGTPASLQSPLTGNWSLASGYLSWIGISAQLAQLSNPNATSNGATAVTGSKPIAVQTGVELRNYGTF